MTAFASTIRPRPTRALAAALALAALTAAPAWGADIGQIKTVSGRVTVERDGQPQPAAVGTRVQLRDVVVTGPDGAVGIVFDDDSLLSAGPGTVLALERFAFDPTTQQGAFETTLRRGTLAAVSGRIARQTPGAMKVRTPAAILGVRGTEFLVRADGSD
jgi:hypothetical protein